MAVSCACASGALIDHLSDHLVDTEFQKQPTQTTSAPHHGKAQCVLCIVRNPQDVKNETQISEEQSNPSM